MALQAVVLAAGKSTRIASIADGLPKPLLEIGGEAVLMRNLRWLAESGIEQVWINLHYRPEAIRQLVGDGGTLGLRVRYSYEPQLLGTAGGVRQIAAGWNETLLVLYGDSLVRADLGEMRHVHRRSGAPVTIGLFDRSRHPHTGIAGGTVTLNSSGSVVTLNEGGGAGLSSLVNAGLYLIEPEILLNIPAASFYDFGWQLFPLLLASGIRIRGHVIDGYCLGVDTPQAYQRALELIHEKRVELG
jgi:NDP-sugar pyrophosphorylase family protein